MWNDGFAYWALWLLVRPLVHVPFQLYLVITAMEFTTKRRIIVVLGLFLAVGCIVIYSGTNQNRSILTVAIREAEEVGAEFVAIYDGPVVLLKMSSKETLEKLRLTNASPESWLLRVCQNAGVCDLLVWRFSRIDSLLTHDFQLVVRNRAAFKTLRTLTLLRSNIDGTDCHHLASLRALNAF